MAQFYQDPNPTNDPNFTGASKEPEKVQANTTMGQLFSDVGNVANKAFPAFEQAFKQDITNDAHSQVDPLIKQNTGNLSQDEIKAVAGTGAKGRVRAMQMRQGAGVSGVSDPDDPEASAPLGYSPDDAARDQAITSIFPVTDSKELPPAAQKELDGVQRLTQAYFNGERSDSYVMGQYLAVTAKLKAKYPGFGDEVDEAMTKITGVQSANAIRTSLNRDIQFNQAAMLQNAGADDKFRAKYFAESAAIFGPNPDKVPMDVLRPAVADYVGKRELLHGVQLRAEVNSPQAAAAMSDTLQSVVTSAGTRMANTAQGQTPLDEFRKQAMVLSQKGGGSPDEVNKLVTQMEFSKQQVLAEMRRQAYTPIPGRSDGHSLVTMTKDGDTVFQTQSQAKIKQWDDMIALAKSGNMSGLQQTTDSLKYEQNVDVINMRRAFPQSRIASTIGTIFPNNPTMTNRFLETSDILPDWAKAIKAGIGNAIINGTATAPAPTPSDAVKAYGPDLSTSGVAYKETVKQYDTIVSKENKNIPNAAHVAKQFFGDQSFYDQLDDNGRLKLFMTMSSPNKTKFVDHLAESDPEVKEKYQQWTLKAAGDIWRRNSDTLQSYITTKGYDISFDPKTLQFKNNTPVVKGGMTTPFAPPAGQAVDNAVASVNNVLTLLKPVVGNDGPTIMAALGVNPSAAKEPGILESIGKAVGDKWEDWKTSANREEIKRGVHNFSDDDIVSMDTQDIPEGMSARDFIKHLRETRGK